MTAPSGILDFFVLEASEYIEQLDGLVVAGGSSGPNAESFQRAARALRGSATMARLGAFADLAASLERAARTLRDGSLRWSPALSAAIVGAVDDLKILVRAARAWGDSESRRAAARAAEISGFLPAERPSAPTPGVGPSGPAFLAGETANVAAGLELVVANPADSNAPGNVLQRLRALRGIAAIKDVPPLPDVLEAADEAIRPLETQQGALGPAHRGLLEAAAAMLRDAARALRGAGSGGAALGSLAIAPDVSERFEAALNRFVEADGERTRVVPVTELFFDDAGPHIVSETPNPPTTRADRFRLEMVGHGEHLRGLLTDARANTDPAALERMRRGMRRALAAIRGTAESFGEDAIADTVTALAESLTRLDGPELSVLTGLAELLSTPGRDSQRLRTELPRLLVGRAERDRAVSSESTSTGPELPWIEPPQTTAPPREPSPAPVAFASTLADVRPRSTTPPQARAANPPPPGLAGAGLASLLDLGIASVEDLAQQPLSAPIPVEETLVPIESLLYRGDSAWRRALELRDDLRQQPNPSREALEELYDLLDLVTEE